MFDAADVLVHRGPIIHPGLVQDALAVIGAGVAQEVPGGLHEGVHGVDFPAGRAAAGGAGDLIEAGQLRQGRAALAGDLHVQRQDHGQVLFRHRHHAAFLAIDDGDGRAPIALPGDEPVPQTEVDGGFPLALVLQVIGDGLLGPGAGHPGEIPGIHQDAVVFIGRGQGCRLQLGVRRLNHHLDGQAVFPGELEIPLVVGRHCHHRAGAVAHEDKVGHVNGHLPAGDRVQAVAPGEDPLLGDLLQGAPGAVLGRPVFHEAAHCGFLGSAAGQFQGQRVLRGQAHEGGAEQGVGPGGEDLNGLAAVRQGKENLGPR